MKRKLTSLIGLLLSLQFAVRSQEPARDSAMVYVYSYHHVKTLGRVAPTVYVDGKPLANLDGTRFFIVRLEPGTRASQALTRG